MENEQNENVSYLIYFNDAKYTIFKKEIITFLDNNNYIHGGGIEHNNLLSFDISKTSQSNWIKNTFYNINDNKKYSETKYYRIIIYKYDSNVYFFEKNGNIKIEISLKNFLNKYNIQFEKIKHDDWRKIIIEENSKDAILNLHKKIKMYHDNYIKDTINNCKELLLKNNINYDFVNIINDYNYENTINKFNDLVNHKIIGNNNKLIKYDTEKCKTINANKDGDEGEYNKYVCESNKNKYILLDKKKCLSSIEIGDIYNIDSNLIYHNKKNNDLRVLSSQIINSALLTRIDKYINEYFETNKIDKKHLDKMKNCEYVFGVIQQKENISLKDKLSLGITCIILDKLNIKYYYDCIEKVINNNTNKNTDTDNNKVKNKDFKVNKSTKNKSNNLSDLDNIKQVK